MHREKLKSNNENKHTIKKVETLQLYQFIQFSSKEQQNVTTTKHLALNFYLSHFIRLSLLALDRHIHFESSVSCPLAL